MRMTLWVAVEASTSELKKVSDYFALERKARLAARYIFSAQRIPGKETRARAESLSCTPPGSMTGEQVQE